MQANQVCKWDYWHCQIQIRGIIIFILSDGNLIPVFPGTKDGIRYYPIKPGYATTVDKIQAKL